MRIDITTKSALVGLLLAVGCGQPSSGTVDDNDGKTPSTTDNTTPDGGSTNPKPTTTPAPDAGTLPQDSCATVASEATETIKPVDIIFVIDNSGSMSEEIDAVERNINNNFAQIIGASGLDYRVIMISQHGSDTFVSKKICISAPLSGTASCSPIPARPTNSDRYFHYSTFINSTDSLSKLLTTYTRPDEFGQPTGGWSTWLRPEANKVFVEITDDDSTLTSTDFDTRLLALTPSMFGTADKRNYVFHSITGVRASTAATKAWEPTDPLQTIKCLSAVNTGTDYQQLSKLTGGLRFPVCEHDSYDVVFQRVAKGVVEGAKAPCDYVVPTIPDGKQLSQITVEYTPGDGSAKQTFKKVDDAASCATGSFFLEGGSIKLCPTACTQVEGDLKAKVQIVFSCEVIIG